jgi:hypothetical protein
MTVSCASVGVWSDGAKANLTAFNTWAAKWTTGVAEALPAILTVAALVPGATPYVAAAQTAFTVLQDARQALASATDAGDSTATLDARMAAVLAAIDQVNQTVADVQALIEGANS